MNPFTVLRTFYKENGLWPTVRKIVKGIWHRFTRVLISYYLHLKRKRYFRFDGKSYQYLYRTYNNTWRGERTVEVPIAYHSVTEAKGKRILEVGNVLQNYYRSSHDVVDKYEKGANVINADILTYVPEQTYDLIVSVSTLEHVGWDEEKKDPEKILRCLENLIDNCLSPGGKLVVTMPLGYNRHVDHYVRTNRFPFSEIRFMKRISARNEWAEVPYGEVENAVYGYPFFFANAIMVGTYKKPA